MKRVSIGVVLIFWTDLCQAILNPDNTSPCREYTVNACRFNTGDIITTSVGEDEVFCQYLCSEVYKDHCKFFHYDRPLRNCQIFGGQSSDPYQFCDQFAGPPSPTFDECKIQDKLCHSFLESNCDFKGNLENGYPDIPSAEMCQNICKHAPDCGYFNYNEDNKNCDIYDRTQRVCRVLIGPPSPSWNNCKPGSNTTTAQTTFPTKSFTPSTVTTTTSQTPTSQTSATLTTTSAITSTTTAFIPSQDVLPSVYMDYHGGDFKTVDGMESWQKCAQQCKEESDCKAWVWNHRSSWHSRGNQCSLKDSLPQLITSHDPLVAGTKEMYEGSCPYVYKDHYGEHFRTERDVQSWKDCWQICLTERRCKAWTWYSNEYSGHRANECRLKEGHVVLQTYGKALITGTKYCT